MGVGVCTRVWEDVYVSACVDGCMCECVWKGGCVHACAGVCMCVYMNYNTNIKKCRYKGITTSMFHICFHPVKNKEYWSIYTGPNFIPDLNMRRRVRGRPQTTRIHNEMDQPNPNKRSKFSYLEM